MASSEDITMPDAQTETAPPPIKTIKKGTDITTRTLKTPSFSYAYLELISDNTPAPALDVLTVKQYLTAALNQLLGLSGTAISVDILKVEDTECWIRVPRQDVRAVLAAVGQWTGGTETTGRVSWRLKGSGNFLGPLVAARGVQTVWSG
jgi:ribonuclease P/MRP protein subunit POP8